MDNIKPVFINYLRLMRAPAMFTAVSNILAAHLIATQGNPAWADLFLLIGASAALYSSGMVLNDWFDYHEDLATRPDRPLISGAISRRNALWFGILLMATGIILAAAVSTIALYLALIIALLVLLYDGILKHTLIASLSMAGCRYFNWILGLSVAPLSALSWWIPLPILLYIMALTLLGQQEEKADSRGYVLLVGVTLLLAAISLAGISQYAGTPGWMIFVPLLALGYIGFRLAALYNAFNPAQVQATMSTLILAIIPLDAMMVLLLGPAWAALAVLILLAPGKMLARYMYVT